MPEKTVDIEIAVVVGSDGGWSALGYPDDEPDWQGLEENLGSWDDMQGTFKMPDVISRIIVKTTVPIPERIAATVGGEVYAARMTELQRASRAICDYYRKSVNVGPGKQPRRETALWHQLRIALDAMPVATETTAEVVEGEEA